MLPNRYLVLAFLMTLVSMLSLGCKGEKAKEQAVQQRPRLQEEITAETPREVTPQTPGEIPASGGKEVAVIKTNLGTIVFQFFPEDAPNHVANFKKLAQQGFYDGICFHRVIPNFMIQAGDPLTKDADRSNDGTGGPGYTIDAEFNDRPHLRGTVSMARRTDPNSAGSQFFICHQDKRALDGQYTVFGQVVEGLDVVDKIANAERDARDNPLEKIVMEKVTIEMR